MLEILKSVRFRQMSVAVILALLIQGGYLGEDILELIAKMITIIVGISAGVGTVDRFSEKIGRRN